MLRNANRLFALSLVGTLVVWAGVCGGSITSVLSVWPVEGEPGLIAVHEASGQVFVNINNNFRILCYSPEGELLFLIGREGEVPVGLAVDDEGFIVVAVNINQNYRVVRYAPTGDVVDEWHGEGAAGGVAIGEEGFIVVAVNINQNYRVVKYDLSGQLHASWGESHPGTTVAIAADRAGGTVVAVNINQNYRVAGHSDQGEVIASWDIAGAIAPGGLAIGPQGEVFVNINQNYRVARFAPYGELLEEYGGMGAAPGEFLYPAGVAITSDGRLYVADAGNRRVQVLGLD